MKDSKIRGKKSPEAFTGGLDCSSDTTGGAALGRLRRRRKQLIMSPGSKKTATQRAVRGETTLLQNSRGDSIDQSSSSSDVREKGGKIGRYGRLGKGRPYGDLRKGETANEGSGFPMVK